MERWFPEVPHTLIEDQGEIRLCGAKCPRCARVFFPPLRVCPDCLDDAHPLRAVPLSTKGVISSYSVAQVAPPGYEVPHVQAYVELPEGVKVFTLMVECDGGAKLKTGQPAEMVVAPAGKAPDGAEILTYRFRPVVQEAVS